jgi:Protein of unknown function DUF262/Protein of unknown function (DUF1524)
LEGDPLSAPSLQFHAEDKSIEDVLFTNSKYRVPRYQRPYSWSADHIEDFWTDLQEGGANTFLGSFVFNHESLKKDGYLEIIDGQQRLLTITLFMALLRNIALELGDEKFAERLQRKCIAFEDLTGAESYRIQPGDSLREFFEGQIQHLSLPAWPAKQTKEHGLIVSNYGSLKELVMERLESKGDKSEKLEELQRLWVRTAALRVIQIDINSEEDAYTIFETVNARGAELTAADLLKNLIFRNVKKLPGGDDKARAKWQALEENISGTRTDLSKFIRHFWLSKNSFTSERTLYRQVKNGTTDFSNLLSELVAASEWYNRLLVGTREDWYGLSLRGEQDIFQALKGIRAMRVSQCYVLFLCLVRNAPKIEMDFSSFFKRIENFTFQYSAIGKLQANKVEKLYSRKAIEIERAVATGSSAKHIVKNVSRSLETLVNELRELAPGPEVFKERFRDIAYRSSEQTRVLIKYFLSKINRFSTTGELEVDFDVVNIEHILPQSPDAAWGLKKGEIKDYVNLLGNLTLVSEVINSKAGNKTAEAKASELGKSEIGITKDVVRLLENKKYVWDEVAIRERQEDLSRLALEKVWTL